MSTPPQALPGDPATWLQLLIIHEGHQGDPVAASITGDPVAASITGDPVAASITVAGAGHLYPNSCLPFSR